MVGGHEVDIPLTSLPTDGHEAQEGWDRAAGCDGDGIRGCRSGRSSLGSVSAGGLGGRGRHIPRCLNRCKI